MRRGAQRKARILLTNLLSYSREKRYADQAAIPVVHRTYPLSRHADVWRRKRADALGRQRHGVITSYSIHYTKLYDPFSVMEASAAACWAETDLAKARGMLTKTKSYPQEREILDEEPKIGVFVCNCGRNNFV